MSIIEINIFILFFLFFEKLFCLKIIAKLKSSNLSRLGSKIVRTKQR